MEQLLTESVILGVIGGAVAILLAIWVGSALRALLLPGVTWATGVLDFRVATVAALAALVTGAVVGLVPAVHAWHPDLLASLRAGGKSAAYRQSRVRTGLLVVQAALSVLLLVGSGLFVRSLRNVQSIDLGFDFERTMVTRVLADTGSLEKEMVAAVPAIIERLSKIPGIESVAGAWAGPMLGRSYPGAYLPGHDSLPYTYGQRHVSTNYVTPGYFRTVGQRIVAGRDFIPGDPPAIIVSEEMARAYWPRQSAIGKCLIMFEKDRPCLPVVGVVEETNNRSIVNDEPEAMYYTTAPHPITGPAVSKVVLRVDPALQERVAGLVSAEIKRHVPRAQVVQVWPIAKFKEWELRPWRLGATLFTAMGILALVVAAIGVYSVIAYATSQRANEMGIRIALGARLRDIARLVVGDGLRTVVLGVVVGIALSLAGGQLVASLLYGISPRDPVIIAMSAIALAFIGIVACIIPALRAARVDPVSSLRAD